MNAPKLTHIFWGETYILILHLTDSIYLLHRTGEDELCVLRYESGPIRNGDLGAWVTGELILELTVWPGRRYLV